MRGTTNDQISKCASSDDICPHLSSGGLHDGLVLAADVAEGKGQLVGESGSEGIGAQVDGHQSLHLFFVEIGQESDLILLGLIINEKLFFSENRSK